MRKSISTIIILLILAGGGYYYYINQQPVDEPAGQVTVHFINVGQGDAILIDDGETEILIDGGDRSPGVVTYLSSYVDGPLEVVIATHPHADHIGGLIAVFEQFDVLETWTNGDTATSKTYTDLVSAIGAEGLTAHTARVHDTITAGALSLKVHHPADTSMSTNNNSIVLHFRHGDVDFLFTGDAEQEAESAMMSFSSLQLPDADVLKIGHHCSRTASSADFLSIARPETAIYMAKIDNTYGHPHAEALANLAAAGCTVYGTDTYGTVTVTSNGLTYTITTELTPAGT